MVWCVVMWLIGHVTGSVVSTAAPVFSSPYFWLAVHPAHLDLFGYFVCHEGPVLVEPVLVELLLNIRSRRPGAHSMLGARYTWCGPSS